MAGTARTTGMCWSAEGIIAGITVVIIFTAVVCRLPEDPAEATAALGAVLKAADMLAGLAEVGQGLAAVATQVAVVATEAAVVAMGGSCG